MSQQTGHVTADARATASPASSPSGPSAAPARPAAVLTVGHADDPMERMADAMADRAVAQLDASEPHRHTPGCGHLRRSVAPSAAPASVGIEGGDLDADSSSQIERARGGGRALPTDVRRRMEGAFGTSLSHVRVHDGPQAAKLSSSMQATAFTSGSDVFFGSGQFSPGTPDGEHVLAHELAHVVTEGSAGVRRMVIRRGIFDKVKALKAKVMGSKEDKEAAKAVDNSKKVEKSELKHHQEERGRGVEQRDKSKTDVYGDGPAPSAPENETPQARKDRVKKDFETQGQQWTKVQQVQERFNAALALEKATFQELVEKYKKAGSTKTEEEIAQEAYKKVWLETADEELRAVRPPRETGAEQLVMQVRVAQTGASVREEQDTDLKESIKRGSMLSKTVEGAYEQMVISARRKQRSAKKAGQELSDEDAYKQARPVGVKFCEDQAKVRKHKTPREMPAEGSAIDKAAFEAAAERVDLRDRKRILDEEAVERLQSQLGAGQQAKNHTKDNDDVAGGKYVDLGTSISGGVGGAAGKGGKGVAEAPGGFAKVKSFFTGKKAPEAPKRDKFETPRNEFDQVTDGVTSAGGVLTSLTSIVSEGLAMARHLKAALSSDDPWEGVKYMKASMGMIDGMLNGASQAATLAKSIKPALSKNVAEVTPVFGVYSAAMGVGRSILDVAMSGRRQHETNTALYDARVRTKGDEADVLVWPLMKMSQAHTKSLENNVWSLGMAVYQLVVALGEMGTLGGAGVPKALQTGGKVIDMIHKFGHYIADQIITWQAKRAKKLSSVLHLEGAAQDELRYHPKMAVDAIILKAVNGDEKAMGYVCNYFVDGKPVTPALVKRIDKVKLKPATPETAGDKIVADSGPQKDLRGGDDVVLTKVRDAILAEMNMDGDPKSTFDQIQAGYASAKGLFGLRDKWAQTGEMAQTRNSHSEDEGFGHTKRSDRGTAWRLKMMLKGEEKFGRSVAKTQVLKGIDDEKAAKEREAEVKAGKLLPEGIACAVGKKMLGVSPTVEATEKFFRSLTLKELEAELKAEESRTPPRNSPGWLEYMGEQLKEKKEGRAKSRTAKQQKAAPKKSNKAQPTSQPSQQKVTA